MRFPIFILITALLTANLSSAAQKAITNRFASASTGKTAVIGAQKHAVTLQNIDQLQEIAPGTPIMPANAATERNKIAAKPLRLDANGTVRLSGAIRGLGMDIYHFSAQAGSRIRILNQRADAMQFAIFRPGMGMRFGNEQILPQSGAYELRIINDRKNAAHNRKAYPYAVTFTLSRGGAAVAPAAPMAKPVAAMARHSTAHQDRGSQRSAVPAPPARSMPRPVVATAQHSTARQPRDLHRSGVPAVPAAPMPKPLAAAKQRSTTQPKKATSRYRRYQCDKGTISANISAQSASVRSGSLVLALSKRSGSGNTVVYSNGIYILTAAPDGSNIYSLDLKSVNGTQRLMSACR